MKRREFIAGLAARRRGRWWRARAAERSGATHWGAPGFNRDRSRRESPHRAFLQALQQLGWTDGRNIQIIPRVGRKHASRVRRYAAELVALAPDPRLTSGARPLAPLLQATHTVPIVFAAVTDPVGTDFVDSLAQSGRQRDRLCSSEYSMSGKWLELLKEIAPEREASSGPSGSRPNRWDRPVRVDPDRGAVARGGVDPDQRARCQAISSAPSRRSPAPGMAA